jgi:3-hydroxyacyl-[acyl-carrier-protein] dehydratase
MLKDSLYKIISIDHSAIEINAALEIDAQNEIFKGHFPEHPTLPGACMLQMVKQVLEDTLEISLKLQKGDNLKFLSLVDPEQNNLLLLQINYTIDDSFIKVNASLDSKEVVCFKFQGTFVKAD